MELARISASYDQISTSLGIASWLVYNGLFPRVIVRIINIENRMQDIGHVNPGHMHDSNWVQIFVHNY